VLCDANLGTRLANAMAAAGHDVTRSIHTLGQAATDEAVLAHAVREMRFLITCDSDFGELVFLKGHAPPPGIIYVRFEPQDVNDIVSRVLAVLQAPNIEGHMVVIGNAGNRMTLFPA